MYDTTTNITKFNGLTCQIPNFRENILERISSKSKDQLYIKFAQSFLAYIPVDYVEDYSIEDFENFVKEAYAVFCLKTQDNHIIDIKDHDWNDSPSLTICVINKNLPFLFSSLNCLFLRLNIQITMLINSIIYCSRDAQGEVKDIINADQKNSGESFIFIKILGEYRNNNIKAIHNEIEQLLKQIEITNEIWDPILARITKITEQISENELLYQHKHIDTAENISFLNWLKNDNFTFLGAIDFKCENNQVPKMMGALDLQNEGNEKIQNIISQSQNFTDTNLIVTGKLNIISPIHHNRLIDYILIRKIETTGYVSGVIIFGLYTSQVAFQSVQDIPIIRQKLSSILDNSNFNLAGYTTKQVTHLIEKLPREILFDIDKSDLNCVCVHLFSAILSKKLKIFVQQNWLGEFVNILIFLPRERLTPEVHQAINHYLSDIFCGMILTDTINEISQDIVQLFVTIKVTNTEKFNVSLDSLEKEIDQISTRWFEALKTLLDKEFGSYKSEIKLKEYSNIFSSSYKQMFDPTIAIEDLKYLKHASSENRVFFNFIIINNTGFELKIYSPSKKIDLSHMLPLIENLGFNVIDERSFHFNVATEIQESWIYLFTLSSATSLETLNLKANVETILDKTISGSLVSGSLSKLVALAGLNWYQIKIIRALTRYLHQTGFAYGKGYVQLTLLKHFQCSALLIQLFENRLNIHIKQSEAHIESITQEIFSYLTTVANSIEDKVLRTILSIIQSIVRTNAYQITPDGQQKKYLSFKFNSSLIPGLPQPVPYAEIYVYSNEFEGLHLRGGKVARGGIRWSDRSEDYRIEILGLMKAQMTKNTVIVPVGSKGGFCLNFTNEKMTSVEYKDKVIECYKNFLRGLLDLTDNIVDQIIVSPANTIIYDDKDPYLVVAADKGTASFSDYANSVAQEYNYWLDDAFASGGSSGYDHKKMGITAKGAWISAYPHFERLKINIDQDPFKVVGIGDMSGDVFGNGLLRSNQIKLVAAFNHMHIFIDPSPDPKLSYIERKRLFELPTSKWSDYDSNLISKGGGVFERSAKSIKLSQEIREILDITDTEMTPENLIKAILMAKVDLLWNGGIGTYIKASTENNAEIGDKNNDSLRCDGNQIRAKILIEGGNLGVSQLGRIEYSKSGGQINTDFIDNSAGVDCSDHEVNIKIALNQAIFKGKLTLIERNNLLVKMTTQIEPLVVEDNYKQAQAITIMEHSSANSLETFAKLIKTLEKAGLLFRKVEFLPSDKELSKRAKSKESMMRPELCVLLSYSKMLVNRELLDASLIHDPYFTPYLLGYFPKLMQDSFHDEIISHPLKHEIIATIITNKIMNQLCGIVIDIIQSETGAKLCDIVRAYVVICAVFDLDKLWHEVEMQQNIIDNLISIEIYSELTKIMRRGISWVIKNLEYTVNIEKTIADLKSEANLIIPSIQNLLVGEAKLKYENKFEHLNNSKVNLKSLNIIAALDSLVSVLDIIHISKITKADDRLEVTKMYFIIADQFNLDWLRKTCDSQIDHTYWNGLATQSIKDDLYNKQNTILIKIINQNKHEKIDLNQWINNHSNHVAIFTDFINDLKMQEYIDLNMLVLANKKFTMFLNNLS